MNVNRRSALLGSLAAGIAVHPLVGCAANERATPGVTKLHVMGTIHSNHLDSDTYSLGVLEAAVRKAAPDVILAEIPPDRIEKAVTSFQETGKIDEPRTQVFPEYTDVIFPLSSEAGFRILGTAGWTQQIADNRREALDRIENDPARAGQWMEYRAAFREYSRDLDGRGDDPVFIHSKEFDDLVRRSREPYEQYFDADLGAGGWTQINRAHTDLINAALDTVTGKGLTALVTFGTAHKYKILESVVGRGDIQILDTRALFA